MQTVGCRDAWLSSWLLLKACLAGTEYQPAAAQPAGLSDEPLRIIVVSHLRAACRTAAAARILFDVGWTGSCHPSQKWKAPRAWCFSARWCDPSSCMDQPAGHSSAPAMAQCSSWDRLYGGSYRRSAGWATDDSSSSQFETDSAGSSAASTQDTSEDAHRHSDDWRVSVITMYSRFQSTRASRAANLARAVYPTPPTAKYSQLMFFPGCSHIRPPPA